MLFSEDAPAQCCHLPDLALPRVSGRSKCCDWYRMRCIVHYLCKLRAQPVCFSLTMFRSLRGLSARRGSLPARPHLACWVGVCRSGPVPLSRLRLGVLLAGGGLGGWGAEQLGDGSLLFAGFPFDVLA